MAKKETSKQQNKQPQQEVPEQQPLPSWHKKISGAWVVIPLVVLLFLAAGWLSWRPLSSWLASTVPANNKQNAEPITAASKSPTTTSESFGGGSAGQQPQVTVNTSGGAGGSTNSGSDGGSGGSSSSSGGIGTDLAQFYKEVESGDTYAQIKSLAGEPQDCIQTVLSVVGLQKVCTWYDGSSSMIVTFIDDNVVSKTSVGL